jgi:hypothetical protein
VLAWRAQSGQSVLLEPTPLSALPVRDLTTVERHLVGAMLSVDGLENAVEYRRQASTARAAPWPVGDGSIYLVTERGMDPLRDVSLPIVEGEVLNENGSVIAGLLLFQYDGWLHYLEVYPFDDTPVPLPPVERARLRAYRRGVGEAP